MITIRHNEQNYEYDIYSMIKAFYPREEVKLLSKSAEEGEEKTGDHVTLQFEILVGDDAISVAVKDGASDILASRIVQKESDAKRTKRAFARELYGMLCDLSGRTLPWGTLTGIRPTKIALAMIENGKSKEEIAAYMKQTYLASSKKVDLAYTVAANEHEILKTVDFAHGYSVYIGIPFCPSTCLYCSFTSYPIGVWKERMDDYLAALFREIDYVAEAFSEKKLDSIYIGGGTPTSLSATDLDLLLTKITTTLPVAQALEFCVEAGRPDSITEEKLSVLKAHGVDRISINPQTMNQKTLDLIGRYHTTEQIKDSFFMARDVGFSNINMDLIVGLPGETIEDVAYTLGEIKKLDPDNLTVHSLALKRAARLHIQWEQYQSYLMENSMAHMDLAAETARELSMEPYYMYRQKNMTGNMENIGFTKKGKAGIYNILIMEEKQSVVALGAGSVTKRMYADGRIARCENVKDVGLYMERIDEMIARKKALFLAM